MSAQSNQNDPFEDVTDMGSATVTEDYSSAVPTEYYTPGVSADDLLIPMTNKSEVFYYRNECERVFFICYTGLLSLLVVGGNGLSFMIIAKYKLYVKAHYLILSCYMIVDLITGVVALGFPFIILLLDIQVTSWTICEISNFVLAVTLNCRFHVVSLLAFERYCFFCRPFRYVKWFRSRRVAAYIVASLAIIIACQSIASHFVSCEFEPVVLLGQRSSTGVVYYWHLLLFIVPSLVVTLTAIYKVCQEVAKRRRTRGAQSTDYSTTSFILKAEASLRYTLLISGLLYFTFAPSALVRTLIFGSGLTWADIRNEDNFKLWLIFRSQHFVSVSFSQALNPVVYFMLSRQMLSCFRKMFKLSKNDNSCPSSVERRVSRAEAQHTPIAMQNQLAAY